MGIAANSIKRLCALAITVSMCPALLSGCATMTGSSAADKDDVCGPQRAAFEDSEAHYGLAVVKGAAVGAAVGAGLGALGAAIGGGDVGKSAAIGAGAGAVTGGVGGYFLEKQRTTPDPQALAMTIQSDVAAENAEIDKATTSFAQLRQCRFAAAEQVKADYAAGRISREEAVRRLDDLRRRFDADLVKAQEMGVKMNEKAKQFQYASDQLVREDPQAEAAIEQQAPVAGTTAKKPAARKQAQRPLAPKTKAVVETAQASETNLIKAKTFDDEVVQAKADSASQFSLEGTVRRTDRAEVT
jgi:hypothetical protein